MLAGYQAAGTRGRALLEGAQTLRMYGKDMPVRARFISVEGLSAHADVEDLVRFAKSGPSLPETAFLVHGEPDGLEALDSRLRAEGIPAIVPDMNDRFVLGNDGHWSKQTPWSGGTPAPR